MGWDPEHIERIETVGILIDAVAYLEFIAREIEQTSRALEASEYQPTPEQRSDLSFVRRIHLRLQNVVAKSDGVPDLIMLCGSGPLTAAWLKDRRREIGQARQQTAAELDAILVVEFARALLGQTSGGSADCCVTILQMGAMVNRSKKTIERLTATKGFPRATVEGGGGKPHEWRWDDVRPILEKEYGRVLPATFPTDRFVR